ncbi:MAG: GntR family transcriptional regulator [Candidatus Cloacimonetes bacterium]|nr:GntR family transcriptional regulator [Candidatus Cloacimonadota bacterium]
MKPIRIDANNDMPIYRQIQEQIRRAILSQEILAGEALPSARNLASALGVNMLTVNKAFQELKSEGLVETRRGEGMFVLESANTEFVNRQEEDVQLKLATAISTARNYGIETSRIHELFEKCLQKGESC